MKWVLYLGAGVVGLIVLAVVVLLVLGGGRGESRLSASVDVARPPEVVFAWVSEPDRVLRWVGWLKEVRAITPDQARVGTRQVWVMEDRNNNNQLMEIDTEFIDYRSPTALTARVSAAEGFVGTVSYELEPVGADRTRLHYVGEYAFNHWLARLLEPLITRSAQQKLEEDLARLKQQAEAESVGTR